MSIYSLIFTITGALDGTTLVNLPIPAASDAIGTMTFAVTGNFGGLDSTMLEPLVGEGGYLLAGLGIQINANPYQVQAGIIGRTGNVAQLIPPLIPFAQVPPVQPPYVERACYVPPQYRLFVSALNEAGTGSVVRFDIAPLRTVRQAARALRCCRPNLLTPVAFP